MVHVAAAKASMDDMVFLDAVTGTPMAPRSIRESVVEAAILDVVLVLQVQHILESMVCSKWHHKHLQPHKLCVNTLVSSHL
jgi:hypothetical protein